MIGYIALVSIAVCGTSLAIVEAADSPASSWSMDPFLGVYDFNFTQGVNAIELIHGVLGVPEDVAGAGERLIFNKTADGRFQQYERRIEPQYNLHIIFEFGQPGSVPAAGNATMNYNFVMRNATTLVGSYEWVRPDKTIAFVIEFVFKPDASGIFITNTVSRPVHLVETGPFYRVPTGDTGPITNGRTPLPIITY